MVQTTQNKNAPRNKYLLLVGGERSEGHNMEM